jgi:diguanylate cyclase (GGDEF)-like protein/PAS domain S-box-containing protein
MSVLVVRLKTWLHESSAAKGTLVLVLAALTVANLVALGMHQVIDVGDDPIHTRTDLALAITATVALVVLPLVALCIGLAKRLEIKRVRLAEEVALHREAHQRLLDFAECSSDWLWESDEEHRFVYFSERHDEVLGIPGATRLGRRRTDLPHGSDVPTDWQAHLDDLANRRPFRDLRYATCDATGKRRIVQVSGKPVFDPQGRFRGYRGIGHDITREYEQDAALRGREQRLSKALHAARVGDWRWDLRSGELVWSSEIHRLWGVDPATFTPRLETVMAWLEPAERARVNALVEDGMASREPFEYEFCGRRPDGLIRHVWIDVVPEEDASGEVIALFGVCRDITEEKQAQAALRASEERFRHFAEAASDWFWETDAEQRFTYLSDRVSSITGCPPQFFLGKRRFELAPMDRDPEGWRAHIDDLEARRPFRDFVYQLETPAGDTRWFKVSGVPVFPRAGGFAGYRGTGTDITEQVQAEDRVRHLAHHDPLTGLPNRTLFQDRLRQALAQAARSGRRVALLQLDLDRFKDVNDTLGHAAGDGLLREAAYRLQDCVRESDTVARLGGDEFAIVLTQLECSTGAGRVARQVVDEMARPVEFQGQTIYSGTSVGVTVYPTDGVDPDVLLKNADIALYQAKENGRNAYSFFVPEMKLQVERRRSIEAELRAALARDEFTVHFQPQVRLADRTLCGFEALLRWRHPERGLVGPAEFIAVAEETGLTVPLGELALWRACRLARDWLDAGLDPGRIALNLSIAQFRRGGLASTVAEVLRDTGLPPAHLELEITEGVLMDRHKDNVLEILAQLHRLGVSLALDDFGTGYASLSHLKQLHVDRLKIDQSFVRDIGTDPDDAAIARAVINLGHSLELEVVAEGVETEEQLGFLKVNGCDFAQGYYFSPPLAPTEAVAYLAAAERRRKILRRMDAAASKLPMPSAASAL